MPHYIMNFKLFIIQKKLSIYYTIKKEFFFNLVVLLK